MSIIGEILAEAERTGAINFGPGMPDPSTFPVEEIKSAVGDVSADELNYTPYPGRPDLVEEATRFLERRGIEGRKVIVTAGGQEAIALLALYLKRHHMGIRVGNPSYLEALTTFRAFDLSVSSSPVDEEGEVPDVADAYYIIPTGHNPTGRTMGKERREAFAQLSRRVFLVEDGTYDLLYYGKEPTPVSALTENGAYIFSLSKVISPGLRIAFLAVPEEMYGELISLRPALNIVAPPISQAIALRLLERGVVERNAERAREVYRKKRDAMVKGLKGVIDFVEPTAGFFVWTRFDRPAMEVLQEARKKGVVFVPGEGFYVVKPDPHTARLSFSKETPERIREGVEKMREILSR